MEKDKWYTKGKVRHRVFCGCDEPYTFTFEDCDVNTIAEGKYSDRCPVCDYYFWIRRARNGK